jgi:hypothetical protein
MPTEASRSNDQMQQLVVTAANTFEHNTRNMRRRLRKKENSLHEQVVYLELDQTLGQDPEIGTVTLFHRIQGFSICKHIASDDRSHWGNGADLTDGKRVVRIGDERDNESAVVVVVVLLAEEVAFAVTFLFGTNCSPVRLSTSFCIALNAKSKKKVYIFSAKTSTACTNSGIVPPYLQIPM